MGEQRLCTLRMLAGRLRRYGLTAAWLRAEAQAGRLPCLWAGEVMLFDVDAVKAKLLDRAAKGEPPPDTTAEEMPSPRATPASRPPQDVMTTAQAAEYLGLHASTMRVWRSTGRYPSLRYIRVGGAIRYRRVDLDAWVRERTVGGDDDRNR